MYAALQLLQCNTAAYSMHVNAFSSAASVDQRMHCSEQINAITL